MKGFVVNFPLHGPLKKVQFRNRITGNSVICVAEVSIYSGRNDKMKRLLPAILLVVNLAVLAYYFAFNAGLREEYMISTDDLKLRCVKSVELYRIVKIEYSNKIVRGTALERFFAENPDLPKPLDKYSSHTSKFKSLCDLVYESEARGILPTIEKDLEFFYYKSGKGNVARETFRNVFHNLASRKNYRIVEYCAITDNL